MSGKLKLLLAVLALGAPISIWYGLSLFSNTPGLNYTNASILTASDLNGHCSRDTDNDGLHDCEETFWATDHTNPDTDGDGFLDGEETLSGHDPTVKGPNDFIDKSKNLTNRTRDLMIGGIQAGDLNPESPQYSLGAERLVTAVLDDYRKNIAVSTDDLKVVGNTPEERSKYIASIAWAIKGILAPTLDDISAFSATVEDLPSDDLSLLMDDPKRLSAFITTSHKLAGKSAENSLKIAAMPVPAAFASQHKNILRTMRILERQYELARNIKQDPLQGMTAIRGIVTIGTQTLPISMANLAEVISKSITSL